MSGAGALPGLFVPTPSFPVVGAQSPVAILFLAHMAVAQFSLGAITLGPILEIWGFADGDRRKIRLARALTKAYYLMFSLGATLGIFAVTVLIGFWGKNFGTLVNQFLPLLALAFGIFPPLVIVLVVYHNTFGRMRPRLHASLGVVLWFLQTLFMVCIVAIDAYMIVPQHAGFLDGALNPGYLPLLLHRLIGNVSWAALFVAGVAVVRLRSASDEAEAAFHSWAACISLRIGTVLLLLMPPLGAALLLVYNGNQPGFFANLVRGQTSYFFVIQASLLALVLIGANLALALERPAARGGIDGGGAVMLGVVVAGAAVGCLPAAVLNDSIYGVRYLGIAVAMLATLAHLVLRSVPRSRRLRLAPAPGAQVVLPFSASAAARWVVTTVGVLAALLSLWMGVVKDEARGNYAIYGEMTLNDAQQPYNPQGVYP